MADDDGGLYKKAGDKAKAMASGVSGLASSGVSSPNIASYKRGGKVKKTGPAKLHKGERVLTKKQAKKYRKGRGKK